MSPLTLRFKQQSDQEPLERAYSLYFASQRWHTDWLRSSAFLLMGVAFW